MTALALFIPVLFAGAALVARKRPVNRAALLGSAGLYIAIAFLRWQNVDWITLPEWMTVYLQFDGLGVYFFSVMTLVFCAAAVYSQFYVREHALTPEREAVYVAEMLVFVSAMSGVILATHLALLWVFVEATTLTSALLIFFERKKSSLEAAWKYVFICSIGIALAFVGIIVLSIGSRNIDSLFFRDLIGRAAEINPFWLKVAFAFLFVGLGTKVGIAPIHAWLPDAHSEAPSPVSALLSGTLLNSAFLGLLRIQEIFIRAGQAEFSNFLFLTTGFLSLLVSAVFMLRLKNYKRMLAYSSVENMGILFIGFGLGPNGVFAALLHVLAHSLSKASLFLTSGNILSIYRSKKIEDVGGIVAADPRTGWLWILSMFAIAGIPPFPVFISKFLIVRAFWMSGTPWLAVPFFLFLVVITFGMGSGVMKMAFGKMDDRCSEPKPFPVTAYAPQFVLLLLLFFVGISMPAEVLDILRNAAGYFH